MSTPSIKIEIAFTTDPNATIPSFTDVTSYVRDVTIKRGRQTERDSIEAGTATIVLDNNNLQFDPNYSSGSYYGYIKPGRVVRISLVYSAVVYKIYHGYAVNFDNQFSNYGSDATCVLTCADFFYILNLIKLNKTYVSEYSGNRVIKILNDAGFNTGAWRSISYGQSNLQQFTATDITALEHLNHVVISEQGKCFIAKDGIFKYLDRYSRIQDPYQTSQGTWGNNGGSEIPYTDILVQQDETQIFNKISVNRIGGTNQTVSDSTSITQHWQRNLSKDNLLLVNDTECLNQANYLLNNYKDPRVRVLSLTYKNDGSSTTITPLCNRDIGDKITVKYRPKGLYTLTQNCYIEGIEYKIKPGTYLDIECTYNLTTYPETYFNYLLLDDVNYGIVGTNRAFY